MALTREGLGILVIVAQDPRFVAAAGVDLDVFGDAQAQVVEAQQGMALGIVLAALAGRARRQWALSAW